MMRSIAGSTERAWIAGVRGATFVPGAQLSSRAKPSASLRRRACVAISGDVQRREIAHIRGIDRQAVHQQLAGRGGALGKLRDRRPWRLRIDVVRSDGRDPAPIIDPRRDQPRIDARRQVGGRLDIHRRAQDEARGGEAPKQVVEIGLRGPGELGAGLGAEVLNDDLLNMPETAVQIADGEQRLQALGARVSPMPIRMPVVNGTRSSPASRSVSRRASGRLSGEP
jgi:hypothetical protein